MTFRLINKETGEIKTQEVFFRNFPIMTEMVLSSSMVVNVLLFLSWCAHHSVYSNDKVDKNGKVGYGSTVILTVRAWQAQTDSKDIAYTRIDRTRKIPFTTLVRALGFRRYEIFDIFGDSELVRNTAEKDIHADSYRRSLKEIYERLRPGEPKTAESSYL